MEIAIFGAGQIGIAFGILAGRSTLNAHPYVYESGYDLTSAVKRADVVVCATPYNATLPIATEAIKHGKIYLDFTEDVEIGKSVIAMAKASDTNCLVIPHCGVAPGAVSIIAADLAKQFDSVKDISMRVGALPIASSNQLHYYRSWSAEGLINEYKKKTLEVFEGEIYEGLPLENLTHIVIDGIAYEAFNTSGGVGTFVFSDIVKNNPYINVRYQTIRYPGHRDFYRANLNAMAAAGKTEDDLLNYVREHIPFCRQDMVQIFIEVTGYVENNLEVKSYTKKVYSDIDMTAIQKTTAGSGVAVLEYAVENNIRGSVLLQENIDLKKLLKYDAWSPYR